jgi:hypothetical protein
VATNVAFSPTHDQSGLKISPSLVTDYKRAHQEMLAALSAMDELAQESAPNQLRLSHTRLRITRASTESRVAFGKVAAALSQVASPSVARTIDTLEHLHLELREIAKRHLSTWTHAQAQEDWVGYCRSSEEVRRRWRELIKRESKLLYPLL